MAKDAQLKVKNWEQFQHYKDRNPPWIKLHFALLASEDWVTLDDASKLLAVVCMLIASRNNGMVPNNPAYLKRVAYLNKAPNLKPLIECGFLEEPLAVDSTLQADDSALQADARPETETDKKDTLSETSSDQKPSKAKNGRTGNRIRKPSKPSGLPILEAQTCRKPKPSPNGRSSTRLSNPHARQASRPISPSSRQNPIWKPFTPAASSASEGSEGFAGEASAATDRQR
ncbi:hypothetical protein LP421_07895 [Rhizobium sp. RCAM05350]|nr:hypothetical protein LP421_07895 [Rhizobium sp. RCAM05350]